jgi:threonyl-tRNA synthetase
MQAMVCTITSDADGYAGDVAAAAKKAGLRVEADIRNEKINYKVREHSLAKVPVLLVVGKKEAAERMVSIRRMGSEKQTVMPLDAALAALAAEAMPPDVKREQEEAEAAGLCNGVHLSALEGADRFLRGDFADSPSQDAPRVQVLLQARGTPARR